MFVFNGHKWLMYLDVECTEEQYQRWKYGGTVFCADTETFDDTIEALTIIFFDDRDNEGCEENLKEDRDLRTKFFLSSKEERDKQLFEYCSFMTYDFFTSYPGCNIEIGETYRLIYKGDINE